ncbi:hypothetical protein LINGRAHAP2_LOCUS8815 [Linum grandiflorum]
MLRLLISSTGCVRRWSSTLTVAICRGCRRK